MDTKDLMEWYNCKSPHEKARGLVDKFLPTSTTTIEKSKAITVITKLVEWLALIAAMGCARIF